MVKKEDTEKEDAKGQNFWWDWGLPMMVVLVFALGYVSYLYWESYESNSACISVFESTLKERDELARNLSVCTATNPISDIDDVLSRNNLFKFCQSKGFEQGGLSSYSCDGVVCIKSNVANGTQTVTSGCYKLSEMIDYVR